MTTSTSSAESSASSISPADAGFHLTLGIVLAPLGFLFSGRTWARGAGIGPAIVSMIANFMWLPYYRFWAVVLIGLKAAVIWTVIVFEVPGESGTP
jgi:hypothetical protein